MFQRFILCVSCGILLMMGSALAQANAGMQFLEKVEAAEASGELSSEEALLYKFYYAFDQDQLPAAFRPAEFAPLKCGTAFIMEFEQRRDELSPRTVQAIEQLLAPRVADAKTPEATYISSNGIFRLTYYTTGGDAVPPLDVDPANGIPDYVEKAADILLFFGCVTSYQDIDIVPNTMEILDKVGIDYATMGNEEHCCGYLAYLVGADQFKDYMNNNLKRFSRLNPKTIVTTYFPGTRVERWY